MMKLQMHFKNINEYANINWVINWILSDWTFIWHSKYINNIYKFLIVELIKDKLNWILWFIY